MKSKQLTLAGYLLAICLAGSQKPVVAELQHLPDEQAMTSEQREMLELEPARQYMLTLINRDRATVGAKPVVLEPIATKAGQLHSDEMAINGYLSHWTMDGRKPDQRYNESGGRDAVMENAFVSLEGTAVDDSKTPNKLPLHSSQIFHRYELDEIESSFFNEKPPNDGHRVNIINPMHTSVGIGLSFASQFGAGVRTSCAQEFVNHYGDFDELPAKISLGESFTLKGKLDKGVTLKIIDVRREDAAKPMTIEELNKTSGYSIPDKVVVAYFADSSQTNEPIAVTKSDDRQSFSQEIKSSKDWQPGLYYIVVWASAPGGGEDEIVSTRTVVIQ